MTGEDFFAAEALGRVIPSLEETASAEWQSMENRILAVQALVLIRDGAPKTVAPTPTKQDA